jgi:DnaJ-class molecular chaperone
MNYNIGPCPKCGGGGLQLPKIKIQPLNLSKPPNYCSKCGKALVSTCLACNGTGRKMTLASFVRDRYCSECGRELDSPDDTCPRCGGTGEIYDGHHFCV